MTSVPSFSGRDITTLLFSPFPFCSSLLFLAALSVYPPCFVAVTTLAERRWTVRVHSPACCVGGLQIFPHFDEILLRFLLRVSSVLAPRLLFSGL